MNVVLDTIPLDITFEAEKNIGDVLQALEKELEENGATLIEVKVDDAIIPADKLDSLFEKSIDAVSELAVKSISYAEVSTIIKQLSEMFDELAQKLEEIPVQLQKNQDKDAMMSVTELADSLTLLFQTIPYLNLFPEQFARLKIDDMPIIDFVKDFPPLLEDFLKAVEANDSVQISDLAEYEIAPRLKKLGALKDSL